jgi:hypothetical protein
MTIESIDRDAIRTSLKSIGLYDEASFRMHHLLYVN